MKVNIRTNPGMRLSAEEFAIHLLAASSLTNLIKLQHERLNNSFDTVTMEIECEHGLSSLNMGNLRINILEEKKGGQLVHLDKLLVGFKHNPTTHSVNQFYFRSTPTSPSDLLNILTRRVEMPTENPPAVLKHMASV